MQRVLLGLGLIFLASCTPPKGSRDRLVKIGNSFESAFEADSVNVPEDYTVKAEVIGSQTNILHLPRLISTGETWLPRTLTTRDLLIDWSVDHKRVFVRGSAQWNNPTTKSSGDIPFVLAGNWNSETGIANLVAVKSETKEKEFNADLRGRIYCIETDNSGLCSSSIVELFVKIKGIIFSGQVQKLNSSLQSSNPSDDLSDATQEGSNDELEGFDQDLEVVGSNEVDLSNLYVQTEIEHETDPINEIKVLPSQNQNSIEEIQLPKPKIEDEGLRDPFMDFSEISTKVDKDNIDLYQSEKSRNNQKARDQKAKTHESSPLKSDSSKIAEAPPVSQQDLSNSSPELLKANPAKKPKVPTELIPLRPLKSSSDGNEAAKAPETLNPADHLATKKVQEPTTISNKIEGKEETQVQGAPVEIKTNLKKEIITSNQQKFTPTPPIKPKAKAEINDEPLTEVDTSQQVPIDINPVPPAAETNISMEVSGALKFSDQSRGAHSFMGSLRKATNLKSVVEKMSDRSHIIVIHPEEKRYYGNYAAIELLVKASVLLARIESNKFLEVGDISDENGGRLRPHKSHQNGLDMDIRFFFNEITNVAASKSVIAGNRLVRNFARSLHWKFFKALMTYYHNKIYFILLHPSVKQAMCTEAIKSGDIVKGKPIDPIVMHTLRRLVPERSHYNHFHLRMKCPEKDKLCVQTTRDIPMTMGCFAKK